MAYTLQAILATSGTFSGLVPLELQIVPLGCGVEMLPLCSDFRDAQGIPFCPLVDDDGTELPRPLLALCESLSKHAALAYVEAEYFGGDGVQAYALFTKGKVVSQPVVSSSAINDALRYLGVSKGEFRDEFEAVGLDRYRNTDDWNPRL